MLGRFDKALAESDNHNMAEKCSHGHEHDHHGHAHGHHHHHGVTKRVGVAFALNLSFAVIELVGGLLTNSMAILSDALHDFGDAVALGMAWRLEKKSQQTGDGRYTYGYRRFSVVSAFLTGVILMSGSIWILSESVPRIFNPEPVKAEGMLGLALLGIVINGAAFFRLSGGSSLNERMLRWHFIEDLAGWILVLIGAGLMLIGGWPWLDPLMAVMLSAWVLWNVFKNLKSTVSVFLQETPGHLQKGEAEAWIKTLDGIQDVHHAHIWSLDGEQHILTAHVVMRPSSFDHMRSLKIQIKEGLKARFGISEATIEFELHGEPCVDPKH